MLGSIPSGDSSLIELAVTNPEYGNYSPRVLVHADENGVKWSTLRRFREAPKITEIKAALGS